MRARLVAAALMSIAVACATGTQVPPIMQGVPLASIQGGEVLSQQPDAEFVRAVSASSLIFAGTVLRRDSAQLMVQVVSVIRTASEVGDFDGDTVAVVDTARRGVNGERAIFLTYGSSLGSSIRVRQVMRVSAPDTAALASFRVRLARADTVIARDLLHRTADSADAVIVGVVDSIAPLPVPFPNNFKKNEHAPDWWRATVMVTGSFHPRDRKLVGDRLPILIAPESGTPQSPAANIERGARRIWLVRKADRLAESYRPGVDTRGTYFVLLPGEVRPVSDSSTLARLLGANQPSPIR